MFLKSKRALTILLGIALFCGNITPSFAKENHLMLPEKSAMEMAVEDVVEEKTLENIIDLEDTMYLDGTLFENNIVSGNDIITDNSMILENDMLPENSILEENDIISDDTILEENETVSENTVLEENETVSENTVLEENETVSENTVLGENSTISENNTLSENKIFSENNILLEEDSLSANSIEEMVAENVIVLKAGEKILGSYSKWSEVMEAIKEVASVTEEYTVEISQNLDLDEKLLIPSKIGRLIIKGTSESDKVILTYIGDVKLTSNVLIDSVELNAKKYNSKTKTYDTYFSTINLNGKELRMIDSSVQAAVLKGNNKSTLSLDNSRLIVQKNLTGVGTVELDNSYLKTKTASITSALMMQSSVLESESKITIKNIISNDEKNRIIYKDNSTKNLLNVTGTISSMTDEGDEKVLWRSIVEGKELTNEVKIRKNAITLQVNSLEETGYEKGSFLGNVSKAGAAWFVIGSRWEDSDGNTVRVIDGLTYKISTKLYSGNANDNVILYSSYQEAEESFVIEGSFSTLQEAFTEIDKIGNSAKYYKILLNNGQEEAASSYKKSLKFPSKTKGLLLRKSSGISEGNLYFKGNITLKSNVKFEDVVFRNTGKCNFSLGKFSLHLKNCYSNDSAQSVEINGITGNGVKKTSAICLEDTILKVNGSVNNVGQVEFLGQMQEEELVSNSVGEVIRIVPAYPELIANGKINVGNVILDTDAKITGSAKITRKKEIVTKITPEIIINDEISSAKNAKLYFDLQEKTENSYSLVDFSAIEMEDWKQEKGIQVVKSFYGKYPEVYLFRNSQYPLIKKGGYFTYYNTGKETIEEFSSVELSFVTEGKEEIIHCYSFADAVTEINNQKVKRDYVITLKKGIEDSSLKKPQSLKFPTKKYVNSLMLRGETEDENIKLGYLGNITFTSLVVLQDISFVQMIKVKGEYLNIAKVKEDYPSIMTLKTGGYDLKIEGDVDFNTPLKIDGGSKGSLILNGNMNTYTNDYKEDVKKGKYVIYGYLTNIHTLSLNDQFLELREVRNTRTGKKYTGSSNKITNLFLEEDAKVKITSVSERNSLEVQNLSVYNSDILVNGNIKLKNVVLEGEQKANIRGDKTFNITGNLEIRTDNGCLETRRKGEGKEPYLNISGKVFLMENTNPLYIGVYYETAVGEILRETPVNLYGATGAASQLLTAKYATIESFRPMEENYPGGEYSESNTNGYVLLKKGTKIYVTRYECK